MENDDKSPLIQGTLGVFLVAMGSASFLVTIFHLIILCRTHRHLTNQNTQQEQPIRSLHRTGQNAVVPHLIPSHKYQKKKKKKKQSDGNDEDDDDDDDTCAVCLGDFEEGEELRTLPECMHSFHVACIDAWLHSHSNCPVCRANATPSPALQINASHLHHTVDIVQIALVQNAFAAPP